MTMGRGRGGRVAEGLVTCTTSCGVAIDFPVRLVSGAVLKHGPGSRGMAAWDLLRSTCLVEMVKKK